LAISCKGQTLTPAHAHTIHTQVTRLPHKGHTEHTAEHLLEPHGHTAIPPTQQQQQQRSPEATCAVLRGCRMCGYYNAILQFFLAVIGLRRRAPPYSSFFDKTKGTWPLQDIVFTSSRSCTNQSSFYSLGPPALPTLLQYYCTAMEQYTTPSQTPLVYAVHYTIILVIPISCKGQKGTSLELYVKRAYPYISYPPPTP